MTRITPDHLSRAAWVYVRQSTPRQVRHNLESQGRQYALRDRAHQLGWSEVVVSVDGDPHASVGVHNALVYWLLLNPGFRQRPQTCVEIASVGCQLGCQRRLAPGARIASIFAAARSCSAGITWA